MGKGWVQPTLGGASVKNFRLQARFHWPTGWIGYLDVQMEDEPEPTTVLHLRELTTPELLEALRHAGDMLQALLGED